MAPRAWEIRSNTFGFGCVVYCLGVGFGFGLGYRISLQLSGFGSLGLRFVYGLSLGFSVKFRSFSLLWGLR